MQDFLNQTIAELVNFEEQKLVSCRPEDSLETVQQMLEKNRVGCIPVLDNNKPVGVFTERDFHIKIRFKGSEVKDMPVGEHMTRHPKTIQKSTTVHEAIGLLFLGKIRHLVVTDADGSAVGMMSSRDIVTGIVNANPNVDF